MKNTGSPFVPTLVGAYWFVAVSMAQANKGNIALDATVIQGVNTAGTVRVNCLANLEALLNIVTNCGELIQIAIGLFMLYKAGKAFLTTKQISKSRILIGSALIISGLATPGSVNWFMASCGGNLFS